MIKPIGIKACQLDSTEKIENQLIYCTDTKEAYFDLDNKSRIQIGCTIQIDREFDLKNLSNIQKDKIYIVKENNKLYRYVDNNFIEVTDKSCVMDLIVPSELLIPTTLNKQGMNYAPKTLAKLVYTNDGNNVEEILKNMVNDNRKILLYTRTEHVAATIDGQRVFGIPFPIPNYDLAKFPMLVIYKQRILASKDYSISNDQVILSNNLDGLAKNEILTFVFHYNVVLVNDNLNATSINNVRFFVSEREPVDKIETDVWFDTKKMEVKQYTNNKWKIIVRSSKEDNPYPFKVIKSTTELATSSTYAEINIPGFNPNLDSIMVYENSVYLEEGEDYTISADNRTITNISEGMWYGTQEDPVVLNFVVFKGTNPKGGSQVIKKSTILYNQVREVGISDFDKNKDNIMVYENSAYLEENEDYTISGDSTKIIAQKTWNGTERDPVVLNFVIFKNSIQQEPILPSEIDKTQIFDALGITEDQFNKLKKML